MRREYQNPPVPDPEGPDENPKPTVPDPAGPNPPVPPPDSE